MWSYICTARFFVPCGGMRDVTTILNCTHTKGLVGIGGRTAGHFDVK